MVELVKLEKAHKGLKLLSDTYCFLMSIDARFDLVGDPCALLVMPNNLWNTLSSFSFCLLTESRRKPAPWPGRVDFVFSEDLIVTLGLI